MLTRTDTLPVLDFGPIRAPLAALVETDAPAVLAFITGTEGPSYRPVGAAMAFLAAGRRVGSLSSGCIEADLALHAEAALADGRPMAVRYGRGSPYIDIELPCGGGLDILLVPEPDRATLGELVATLDARWPARLEIDRQSGALGLARKTSDARGDLFAVEFLPELRFHIYGKGPEASTFAGLAAAAGYPNLLLSPDRETLEAAGASGCDTRHLVSRAMPADLAPDAWTAVVLFFHDHDWEPPILKAALASEAFYIGAQGSRRARDARLAELEAMGVGARDLERLRGPIGLVPSSRDARTLAVSVLAEILAVAKTGAP